MLEVTIFFFAVLCILSWLVHRDVFHPVTFTIAFWTYLYCVQPVVEILRYEMGQGVFESRNAELVVTLSFAAMLCFFAGALVRELKGTSRTSQSSTTLNEKRVLLVFGLFYFFLWLTRGATWSSGRFFHVLAAEQTIALDWTSVASYVFSSGANGHLLLFMLPVIVLAVTGNEKCRNILMILIPVEFTVSLVSGWRSFLPIVILLIVLCRHWLIRPISLPKAFAVTLLAVVVFVPVRYIGLNYRVHSYDIYTDARPAEAVGYFLRTSASEFLADLAGGLERKQFVLDSLIVLDAHLNTSQIVRQTNSQESYEYGATIVLPLLRYPAKLAGASEELIRDSNVHNLVARKYGLADYHEYGFNVTVPAHAELYLNFGMAGVVLGMILLGYLYEHLGFTKKGASANPRLTWYLAAWYYLVLLGTFFSLGTLLLLALIKLLVFWFIYHWLSTPDLKIEQRRVQSTSSFELS